VTGRASAPSRNSVFRWAIALSVLLHVLLIVVLNSEELIWSRLWPEQPPPIVVDLVPPPQPAQQPPPPKPAERQQAEQKQEQPKPEEPKPEPKPERKPQEARHPPPPLTRPQLMPGRIAETSSVPNPVARNGAAGTSRALSLSSGEGAGPKAEAKAGPVGVSGPLGPDLTQSEQDFILAQIMKYWRVDFHAPEARGLSLSGVFYVLADGTLASPVNKSDPWNPAAVVDDYNGLSAYRRDAVDGFLLALRLAQPLQLPPSKGPWPRKIVIRFAFDTL
jgi:hypothetical protein